MSNPKAMVDMMLKNNPNAAAIKKLIEDNGGDFEKAGRALAKQKGVDPDEILKTLM